RMLLIPLGTTQVVSAPVNEKLTKTSPKQFPVPKKKTHAEVSVTRRLKNKKETICLTSLHRQTNPKIKR
ncbi:MAG: hypothetical protein WCC69_14510, partial [Pirellulales bacterium]